MYCPSCGAESTSGLKYCKQCGANLSAPAGISDPKKIVALFWPIALVAIVGIVGLLVTATEMAHMNFDPRFLLGIVAFISAMIFGIAGLMIWLLLRLTGLNQTTDRETETERRKVKDTGPTQLPEPAIGLPSVTEHTTRNFEFPEEKEYGAQSRKPGRKATQ